jgi:hypothetical protein
LEPEDGYVYVQGLKKQWLSHYSESLASQGHFEEHFRREQWEDLKPDLWEEWLISWGHHFEFKGFGMVFIYFQTKDVSTDRGPDSHNKGRIS